MTFIVLTNQKKVNFLALIFFLALLISCQTNDKKEKSLTVKMSLEESIKKWMDINAHDPKSYEFISLMPIDTVFQEDLLNRLFKINSINSDKTKIKDSLLLSIKPKTEYAHTLSILRCRLRNQSGGVSLSEFYVQSDSTNNSIFEIVESRKQLNRIAGVKKQYLKLAL